MTFWRERTGAQHECPGPPQAAECDVTVTRVFDAPRELVFRTWIEPEHLMRWWGPRGFTNPVCELDARVGGAIFVRMHGPNGRVVLMTGTFREIVAPERLVLSAVAADRDGHPQFEGLVTATFEDEGGKTRLDGARAGRRHRAGRGSDPRRNGKQLDARA